jgi:fructokinase
MGGGVVVSRPELLALIRAQFVKSLNGYLDLDDLTGGVDRYVVAPGLGALAGPLGALALALQAAPAADAASVANKRAGC